MKRRPLLSAALVVGSPPLQITAAILAMLLVVGCATKNDAGVVLYKQPDFLGAIFAKGYVVGAEPPKTPISKFARLSNPITRTTITKGKFKGHEVWSYEWDAPNDEVNNQMFTDVLVKDGIIVDVYEETTDKWQKNPKLYASAKLASAYEDLGALVAQSAQRQRAASMAAAYASTRKTYDAGQFLPIVAPYRPWENAQPVNYGMVGNMPLASSGRQRPASVQRMGNMFFGSDGSSVQRIGNQYYGSDGSSAQRIGNQIYGSDGSSAQIIGNQIYRSDGSSSQRIGNQIYHSDGGTTQIIGNTMYNN